MEVGSNLATMTSIAALATTAGVMRAQGPRLLRGPIGLLGASSSLALRISQRRKGRQLRLIEGVLVVDDRRARAGRYGARPGDRRSTSARSATSRGRSSSSLPSWPSSRHRGCSSASDESSWAARNRTERTRGHHDTDAHSARDLDVAGPGTASPGAAGERELAQGDAHFLAEQYDEAEACYRAALELAPGDAGAGRQARAGERLRRHRARRRRAAAGDLPASCFDRDRLLAGPDLAPVAEEPPPPSGVQREGMSATVTHGASIKLGQAAGRRRVVRAPSPHRGSPASAARTTSCGRTGTRAARGSPDRLAKLVADPQARPHARDAVRQQPRASVPRRREHRVLRHGQRAAGRSSAVAHRRRQLEQDPARCRRALRSDGRAPRTPGSSATSATIEASTRSGHASTPRPRR